MSMEFESSSEYSASPRHSWWSMQSTREKKLTIALAAVSVLAIIFCICTIALGSKKTETVILTITPAETSFSSITPQGEVSTSNTARTEVSSTTVEAEFKTTAAPSSTTTTALEGAVCSTRLCIETANDLLSKIKEDANPCENFYSFACGRYEETEKTGSMVFNVEGTELAEDVKDILDTADPEVLENPATKSAVRLYHKCKNQHGNDLEGRDFVRNLVEVVLGTDWPMAVGAAWEEDKFDLMQSFARLNRLGQSIFFNFMVFQDLDKPFSLTSLMSAYVDISALKDPLNWMQLVCTVYPECKPDVNLDPILLEGANYASGTPKLKVDEKPPPLPESKAEWLLEMKKNNKKYTVKQLQNEIPKVNWKLFFETLFKDSGFIITDIFTVLTNASEFRTVIDVLASEKRFAANMIGRLVVQNLGKLFSSRVRNAWPEVQSLDDICYNFVIDVFEYAVGKLYISKHLPGDSLAEIRNITKRIKEGFETILDNSLWLDDETKNMALKKLQNMETAIAAPEWIWKDDALRKFYEGAEILEETPFEFAALMAMENKVHQNFVNVGKTFDRRNYWPTEIFETNAEFNHVTNTMYYQLGMLRRPFYVQGRFGYINLAALGYVAGHEIVHGFDWSGKDFDENGLINNWWNAETLKTYEDSARCFITQYTNIKDNLSQLYLNGTKTMSENIADNGGLKAAYQAYKNSASVNNIKLVGLDNAKDEQLFFLSAAQIWCAKMSKAMMISSINGGIHSPVMYRAIVPFQNYPEFSKAFNCEMGSNMNPEKKCEIW